MSNYRLTGDAKSDLIEIRRFTLNQWGDVQSKKYLSELHETISLLSETPSIGKLRSDIGEGVLSFPYVSHIIYYLVVEKTLIVFGILHKRMIPINHLYGREI